MSFTSWLTGRDEKESDVYANYDKVESVVSNIKSISSNQVESARDAVHTAVNELNNVNGLAQFVGSVDAGAFDGVFESIASAIVQIGEQVQNKANDIKTYEESAWYEKLGSTFAMAGAKFGEGVLSVAEDLGDGVVSVAGWVAPKDSGFEKACKNFVEKEWSHDAFNFYYDSEFAKKSTFTEDSAAAAGFKIAGATTGYLYLGGVATGLAEGAGVATKGSKAAKAANLFFGNTTRANTTTAVISGMGSGTESGLRQGKSFDEAAWGGVKQGAAQGVVAYGMGKLGEKNAQKAKDKAINEAQNKVDDVSKKLTKAEDSFESAKANAQKLKDDVTNGKVLGSKDDVIKQAKTYAEQGKKAQDEIVNLTNSLDDANNALNNAKNIKVQGYNDAITKSGQKAGANYAKNISENGFVKGTVQTIVTDPAKAGVAGAKSLGSKAVNAAKTFKSDPGTAVSTARDTATSTAKNSTSGLKSAGSKALDAAKHPVQTAKSTAGAVKNGAVNTAKTVVTSPSAPGVIGAAANAAGRNMVESKGKAAEQFRKDTPTVSKPTGDKAQINTDVNYTPGKKPTVAGTNQAPTTNPNNNGGGNYSGGGSSSGGGYSGGGGSHSGGGSTTITAATNPSSGSEQFRHNTNNDDKSNKDNNDKKTTNTNNKPATNPTTPTTPTKPTTGDNNGTTVVTKPSNPGTNTTQHTGGGYNGSGGYRAGNTGGSSAGRGGYSGVSTGAGTNSSATTNPIEDITSDTTTSIDDVIKGSKYTKIPTSSKPITTTSSGSGGSAVIPVVAGLSAAAAAGVGAKVYMDHKNNNENGEYDEIDTEDWAGEDTISLDYDDSSDTEAYLDEDDDYGYQAEEQTERYDARNNEELADLQ